ncbi:hypothetical protein GCM10022381_41780 [Leifsonia kafniensis]|uniref:DNA-binding protein n=2 Tax=Leifsonia kafniensis TaxID=475957 RepID=A0ABP7L6M6_9MICO
MRAFAALQDAIAEDLIDSLPPVLTIREIQAVTGTSASYLRSSITAGRLNGRLVDERWELSRDDNRSYIKNRVRKRMNRRAEQLQRMSAAY